MVKIYTQPNNAYMKSQQVKQKDIGWQNTRGETWRRLAQDRSVINRGRLGIFIHRSIHFRTTEASQMKPDDYMAYV